MRYAVTYDQDFRYIKEINEIIFNPKDLDGWKKMTDFIDNNIAQEQDIIINISELKQDKSFLFSILTELNKKRNIKVQIDYSWNDLDDYISFFKENNIVFMFINVATSRNFLKTIIKAGANEIYIAGGLLHELDNISNLKNIYNFKIRTFPNVILPDAPVTIVECGWIRPEDTEAYEKYIDVFEFYKTPKASIYYEIYKEKKWQGKVYEIIENCDINVFNDILPANFGNIRAICHQDCIFEKCQYCDNTILLTNLIEKGIVQHSGSSSKKDIKKKKKNMI